MNKRERRSTTSSLLAAAVFAATFAVGVQAESACKGLEKRQCEGKGDCTWVDGYTRKDGVKVASYCKSVGNRSSSSSSKEKTTATKSKESTTSKKSSKKED
jgi:hypothetical protein